MPLGSCARTRGARWRIDAGHKGGTTINSLSVSQGVALAFLLLAVALGVALRHVLKWWRLRRVLGVALACAVVVALAVGLALALLALATARFPAPWWMTIDQLRRMTVALLTLALGLVLLAVALGVALRHVWDAMMAGDILRVLAVALAYVLLAWPLGVVLLEVWWIIYKAIAMYKW
jgi:hypothetical protein